MDKIIITAAALGSHGVRVGLEDNLYLGKVNWQKVANLIYEITEREPATPNETRKILGLKGKDKSKLLN